jgi:hypothetical protein
MANASYRDAAIGYDYFWQNRGKISREDVNKYLSGQRRFQISTRTFGHYRNLLSHGVRHYVSINRFDVLTALERLDAVPDRSGYMREAIDIAAQVSIDNKDWIEARVIDRSQIVLGILINRRISIPTNSPLWVRTHGYDDIPTVVIWRELGEDFTRVDVRAAQFLASYRDNQGESYHRGFDRLFIERDVEEKILWDDFYRVLTTANELIQATTELLYTLGDAFDTDIRVAETVIQRISFGSPGGAELKIDFGVGDVMKLVLDTFHYWKPDARIREAEAERKQLENRQLKYQIEVDQEKSDIEAASQREDLKRKQLDNLDRKLQILSSMQSPLSNPSKAMLVDAIAEQIKGELPEILGVSVPPERLPELFAPGTPERGLLGGHLLPAAARLYGDGDEDFMVKIDTGGRETSEPS